MPARVSHDLTRLERDVLLRVVFRHLILVRFMGADGGLCAGVFHNRRILRVPLFSRFQFVKETSDHTIPVADTAVGFRVAARGERVFQHAPRTCRPRSTHGSRPWTPRRGKLGRGQDSRGWTAPIGWCSNRAAVARQHARLDKAIQPFVEGSSDWQRRVEFFNRELELAERAAVDHLARRFRMTLYRTFRLDRPEYDRRRATLMQLVKQWKAAGSPADQQHKLVDWLVLATDRSARHARRGSVAAVAEFRVGNDRPIAEAARACRRGSVGGSEAGGCSSEAPNRARKSPR